MNRLIKSAFSDDPELIALLEQREFNEQAKFIAEKAPEKIEEFIKGEQGDDGFDGATGPQGERGEKGDKGDTGERGPRGFAGEDGKTIVGTPGKDGSPDTPKDIVKKLNTLENVLDVKVLKDKFVTEEKLKEFSNQVYTKGQVDMRWHGGGLSTVSHDATLTGSGTLSDPLAVASPGGGTAVYNEVVAGSATTFTLAATPTVGTVRVYAIGQRLTPGVGNDYTISGAVITTALSWSAGQILADYSTP